MVDMEPIRQGDPSSVAGYRIAGRLGEGWQGTVFSGLADDGTQVAVKLLHADLIGDPATAERFVQEVQAFTQAKISCAAQVLGAGMYLYQPYVISEYVDGFSLADSVRVNGPCQGPDLDRLAVNTATALAALHKAGLRHGDFHPANVLLGPAGPTVIDIGVARALDQSTGTAMSGQMIGSPEYMTPEQIADQEQGPAADVFAWAATVAFAATGRPPFAGDSPEELFQNITSSAPSLDGLQSPLRDLVTSCLAKSPQARPNSTQLVELLSLNAPAAPARAPDAVPAPERAPAPGAETVTIAGWSVSAPAPGPEPVPAAETVAHAVRPAPEAEPVPAPETVVQAVAPAPGSELVPAPVPAAETVVHVVTSAPGSEVVPASEQTPAPAAETVSLALRPAPEAVPAPGAETVSLAGWSAPALPPGPVPAAEQGPGPAAEPLPLPGWSAPVPMAAFPAAPPAARRRRSGLVVVGAAAVAVVAVAVPAVALMRGGDDPPKVVAASTTPVPSPEPSVIPTAKQPGTRPVDLEPKTATPSKTKASKKPSKKAKPKPQARPNLIANGGFETGLAGWANVNGMPVGDGQHSGKGAAQINAGPNGEAKVERVISGLKPKTTYLLSGWVRSGNGYNFLGVRDYDTTVGMYLPVTVNNYTALAGTFTTGPGVTKATVFCWRKEPGSGWCDDISLRQYK